MATILSPHQCVKQAWIMYEVAECKQGVCIMSLVQILAQIGQEYMCVMY